MRTIMDRQAFALANPCRDALAMMKLAYHGRIDEFTTSIAVVRSARDFDGVPIWHVTVAAVDAKGTPVDLSPQPRPVRRRAFSLLARLLEGVGVEGEGAPDDVEELREPYLSRKRPLSAAEVAKLDPGWVGAELQKPAALAPPPPPEESSVLVDADGRPLSAGRPLLILPK